MICMFHLTSRYQQHWLYDDEERVCFKNVSLPANIIPETIVKVM